MDTSLAGLAQYLYLFAIFASVRARSLNEDGLIVMPSEISIEETESLGTRWAVLVAGSSGYWNYRHQADVCHAYQILRKGGLKDENIVVFMYDDIAYNKQNPHPGVIINRPGGPDVYAGVPKDYTGKDVNVENLLAVILGNKTALRGGSGKVVDSGPNDHIFIFYTDHGGAGVLGMPAYGYLYADEFINALKQKHAARAYKEMVIYVEACESGSIFEGVMDEEMEIYVTTAANAEESSWATYCPGMDPPPPPEYDTCLGDLYSVAWMEDSEIHNMRLETLNEQYVKVKDRTSNNNTYVSGSHVMKYGDVRVESEEAYIYIGSDPAHENLNVGSPSHNNNNDDNKVLPLGLQYFVEGKKAKGLNQRDADLLYFWRKYQSANGGQKIEARNEFMKEMGKRTQSDGNIEELAKILFGKENGLSILKNVRPSGQPLVDDWTCLRTMVGIYERHCGDLGQYGMKHMRAFANICNARIDIERMESASSNACASNIYTY